MFLICRIPLCRQTVTIPENHEQPFGAAHLLGTVPQLLRNYQNVYYYGEVIIGTPGDKVRLVFDTGSPSLWVYSGSGWRSWLCPSCWVHNTYHHSRSSTYSPVGKDITINYVSGYMSGYSSQDLLTIGNLSVRVELVEATRVPFFSSLMEQFDGILGLSPCPDASCPYFKELTDPVIHSILTHLSSPTFSIYLDRSGGGTGEITFGGTNQDLFYEDSLKMHPTTTTYTWTLAIESVWVGEKMLLNYTSNLAEAYIDTGTTLIVGPPMDVRKILAEMGIPYGVEVPCSRIRDLPSITFVIGGEKYTLTSQDFASLREKPLFGPALCSHGFEGIALGGNTWILGDVFLGNYYSLFNLDGGNASKIGFAKLKVTP